MLFKHKIFLKSSMSLTSTFISKIFYVGIILVQFVQNIISSPLLTNEQVLLERYLLEVNLTFRVICEYNS